MELNFLGGDITLKDAVNLVKNHMKAKPASRSKNKHTIGCWFSIEELKTYIQKVEENKGDGIRIYFGVYPEAAPNDDNLSEEVKDQMNKIAGMATVLLVGTQQVSKEVYEDIIPKHEALYLAPTIYNGPGLCPPYNCPTAGIKQLAEQKLLEEEVEK